MADDVEAVVRMLGRKRDRHAPAWLACLKRATRGYTFKRLDKTRKTRHRMYPVGRLHVSSGTLHMYPVEHLPDV
jgi:hypothetical protein